MVTKLHRDALRSDIESVRELLARATGRDPLGEMTLSMRLRALEAQLREIEGEVRNVANVALVFDGGPVRGSSAIDADFAGQALQDYQELLTKQVAAAAGNALGQRGPLPMQVQKKARMNITALVHGSFGFLLEEDGADQVEMFESSTLQAVEAVTDLLKGVASNDRQWFDSKLPELDVRIFQSLRRFINTLHKADSTLKLSEDQREITLTTYDVMRAYERISEVDIDESEESFEGELLGIVPIARRFEFRRADNGEILSGRVAENLSADYLERIEREELMAGRNWRALVRTKTVSQPNGRQNSVTRILIDLLQAR
jgi:hypothetical protein